MTKTSQWWRGAVTYQVYPRSFQDSNGDGIGDLAGIVDRLDYIAALGVDAIWLSPFFSSPMKDMGYDVSDYRGVDPLFGTIRDFELLLCEAHARGLKVVIDQVLSHSSDQHPCFKASRQSRDNDFADWYIWADANSDGTPPNNWLSHFGGPAWTWDSRRKQFYLHNFLPSQPDFNFHNPEVRAWHLENMRFWLEMGVDGFRLDTVNYYFHDLELRSNPVAPEGLIEFDTIPYFFQDHIFQKSRPENLAFLTELRALTDSYDNRVLVGEISAGHRGREVMANYTRGDDRLHMAYSFDLLGPKFSPKHFRGVVETFFEAGPTSWPAWAFSNHDTARHVSRWSEYGEPDAIAQLASTLLLSLEGSIFLYQGEELGQVETELEFEELRDPSGIAFWPDYKGRDGCRTPMVWVDGPNAGFTNGDPWLPIKPSQIARNVADQSGPDSILSHYQAMIALRREKTSLQTGRTQFLDLDDRILAFGRGSDVLCVFNLSGDPVVLPELAAGVREEMARGFQAMQGGVTLEGLGYAILSLPAGVSLADVFAGRKGA
ncbi:MAG: alpha glucosidase [Marivivens sp.]|nr:alpha glucosidase [Marivivens sp.]